MTTKPNDPAPFDHAFWLYGALPRPADITRWRELSFVASPGPWVAFDADKHPELVGENWDIAMADWFVTTYCVNASRMSGSWEDYPYIAASRTAVPALIALLDLMAPVVEAVERMVESRNGPDDLIGLGKALGDLHTARRASEANLAKMTGGDE